MIPQAFELIPFPAPRIPQIQITGSAIREGHALTIQYLLSGAVDAILIPSQNPRPDRRNGLWLATCFEWFLAVPGQSRYWEFNFSPSGDWNVYRMEAYRQISFQEEEFIQGPGWNIRKDQNLFSLEITVDISPILAAEDRLLLGISSVIQTLDGNETYWALTHAGSQADFHHRESFILALEGSGGPG